MASSSRRPVKSVHPELVAEDYSKTLFLTAKYIALSNPMKRFFQKREIERLLHDAETVQATSERFLKDLETEIQKDPGLAAYKAKRAQVTATALPPGYKQYDILGRTIGVAAEPIAPLQDMGILCDKLVWKRLEVRFRPYQEVGQNLEQFEKSNQIDDNNRSRSMGALPLSTLPIYLSWEEVQNTFGERKTYEDEQMMSLVETDQSHWMSRTKKNPCINPKLPGVPELISRLQKNIQRTVYFMSADTYGHVRCGVHMMRRLFARQIITDLGLHPTLSNIGARPSLINHVFTDWHCFKSNTEERWRNLLWGNGKWSSMSHVEGLNAIDASTIVVGVIPDICLRQILADMISEGDMASAPDVIVCEKILDSERDKTYCACRRPCVDISMDPFNYTCETATCKDPYSYWVQTIIGQLYHEIPLFEGDSNVTGLENCIGHPALYIKKEVARECNFAGVEDA